MAFKSRRELNTPGLTGKIPLINYGEKVSHHTDNRGSNLMASSTDHLAALVRALGSLQAADNVACSVAWNLGTRTVTLTGELRLQCTWVDPTTQVVGNSQVVLAAGAYVMAAGVTRVWVPISEGATFTVDNTTLASATDVISGSTDAAIQAALENQANPAHAQYTSGQQVAQYIPLFRIVGDDLWIAGGTRVRNGYAVLNLVKDTQYVQTNDTTITITASGAMTLTGGNNSLLTFGNNSRLDFGTNPQIRVQDDFVLGEWTGIGPDLWAKALTMDDGGIRLETFEDSGDPGIGLFARGDGNYILIRAEGAASYVQIYAADELSMSADTGILALTTSLEVEAPTLEMAVGTANIEVDNEFNLDADVVTIETLSRGLASFGGDGLALGDDTIANLQADLTALGGNRLLVKFSRGFHIDVDPYLLRLYETGGMVATLDSLALTADDSVGIVADATSFSGRALTGLADTAGDMSGSLDLRLGPTMAHVARLRLYYSGSDAAFEHTAAIGAGSYTGSASVHAGTGGSGSHVLSIGGALTPKGALSLHQQTLAGGSLEGYLDLYGNGFSGSEGNLAARFGLGDGTGVHHRFFRELSIERTGPYNGSFFPEVTLRNRTSEASGAAGRRRTRIRGTGYNTDGSPLELETGAIEFSTTAEVDLGGDPDAEGQITFWSRRITDGVLTQVAELNSRFFQANNSGGGGLLWLFGKNTPTSGVLIEITSGVSPAASIVRQFGDRTFTIPVGGGDTLNRVVLTLSPTYSDINYYFVQPFLLTAFNPDVSTPVPLLAITARAAAGLTLSLLDPTSGGMHAGEFGTVYVAVLVTHVGATWW